MSDTTTTPTTDTPPADELAALKAQVAALTAAHTAATEAAAKAASEAEEARKAGLTEAQKLDEERKAFAREVEAERGRIVTEARRMALTKLGVLDKAFALAPAVDPRDPKGAAELEAWARANHEFVRQTDAPPPAPLAPAPESKLAKVLAGALKSPYITADGLRRIIGS